MSDSTAWQPPVAGPAPAGPSTPFSAPGAPYGAPQQPAQGWTPPPKPGLIPLRPLTFGTMLGAAFQVLRRNPKPTFGFALLVTGAVFLVTLVVIGLVTFFAASRAMQAAQEDQDVVAAGSVLLIVLSALVPAALSVVVSALVQGVVSLEVARGTLGEKHRLRGLWRAAKGRLLALVGWSGIVFAAIALGLGALALVIALFAVTGGAMGVLAGVFVVLLLGAGFAVLAAWLGTKLALVPSAIMIERLGIRDAVVRSWTLTGGYFWKTFGILLLVAVIVQTVGSIVTTPLSFLLSFGAFLIDPNGTSAGAIAFTVVSLLLTAAVSVVIGAVTLVVQSSTPALVYIDLRMRKEGLDLELQRFVEARQAGDATVPDPYLAGPVRSATAGGSAWA